MLYAQHITHNDIKHNNTPQKHHKSSPYDQYVLSHLKSYDNFV